MADRRFSDDEVARILARAVELQEARSSGNNTLTDIERAAAEAGIDPALVRDAAAELSGTPTTALAAAAGGNDPQPFFGKSNLSFETHIDGVVDADAIAVINDIIQQTLGLPATASSFGHTVQWTYIDAQNARTVMASVTSRGGRTIVRFQERLGGLMGGIYGGVGGGAGGGVVLPGLIIGGIALAGPVGGVVGGVVGTAVSFVATRALYRGIVARRERKLQASFDAVVDEVRARAVVGGEADGSIAALREREGILPAPQADAVVPVDNGVNAQINAELDTAVGRRRR